MASRKKTLVGTKTAVKRRVAFAVEAGAGHTVSVAGSFNDWDACAKMLKDDGSGIYRGTMMLAPGTYEYKFVVDDDWKLDDRNPNFAPNDYGTLNSVLVVE